jgi:DNA (cytosine-5)-methyltransferase 1
MGKSNDEIEITNYLCEKIPELNNFKREKKEKFGMKFKNEIYEIVKKNNDNECIQKYNILCSYKKSLGPIKMVNGNDNNEKVQDVVEEDIEIKNTMISTDNLSEIEDKKIKFIDLFCGIGSFHYSFSKKNWECIMASDIDETTHEVYKQNYNINPLGDIYKIDEKSIPNYDVLCAGFPCQAFSQAGKHNGLSDKRGILFQEILRFASYHKPKVLALENVSALLKHDKGNTFKIITDSIKDLGYNINYKILKCSDYGIPQMRKRLIILCIRNDIKHDVNIFDLSKYEKDVSLKDYLSKNFEKKCAYTIRCGGKGSPINDRHNWDGYWVDGKEYRLSIDDAKKLQGFDEGFIMATKSNDAWRHLGNTIPTIFTKIIADKIEEII